MSPEPRTASRTVHETEEEGTEETEETEDAAGTEEAVGTTSSGPSLSILRMTPCFRKAMRGRENPATALSA